MTDTITPASISLTESAAERIDFLRQKRGQPDLMLRITVDGGGCAGFQYLFDFDTNQKPEDIKVEQHGVAVLVDDVSLGFLEGAEIDFVKQLVGAAFQIKNPNANSSCGCGTSFSV